MVMVWGALAEAQKSNSSSYIEESSEIQLDSTTMSFAQLQH